MTRRPFLSRQQQPMLQLLRQQQQRMNMAVACCCAAETFACGLDDHTCARIVDYTGTFFGNVKWWNSGLTACADGNNVGATNIWDGEFREFTLAGAEKIWIPDTAPSGDGFWYYATTDPVRTQKIGGNSSQGTKVGCLTTDDDTPGYWYVRIAIEQGVIGWPNVVMYWTKNTGLTNEGVYTYTPTLPPGWSSWPDGIPPSDLDAGCYTPTPETLEIEHC